MALSVGRMTNKGRAPFILRGLWKPWMVPIAAGFGSVGIFTGLIAGLIHLDALNEAEHPFSIARFEVRGIERFFLDQGDDFEAMVPNGTGGFNKVRYAVKVGPTEYRHDVPDGEPGWIEGVRYKNQGTAQGSDGVSHDVYDGQYGSMVVHYGGAPLVSGVIEKSCKSCPPTHPLHELH